MHTRVGARVGWYRQLNAALWEAEPGGLGK